MPHALDRDFIDASTWLLRGSGSAVTAPCPEPSSHLVVERGDSSGSRQLSISIMLPSDIVQLISLELLEQHPYYHARNLSVYFDFDRQTPYIKATDLINYSMTCRSIRAMCMPRLFASIVWNYDRPAPDPAVTRALSPYVRAVRIFYPSRYNRDAYVAFLAQLPDVRELHVDRLATKPFEAHDIDWAFISRPVEVMVLTICGASALYLAPGLPVPPLREFTVIAPRRMARLSQLSVHLLRMENSALEYVLDHLRDSLEVLRVPGDAMRLSFLGAAHWPRLTRFAHFGGHPFADASWSDVLSVMPVLQSFILDTAYIQPAPPVYLWPPQDEGVTPGMSLNIPNLRGLVLSSPRPRDRVFALLPPTLIELALRDTPRYDRERTAPRVPDTFFGIAPDPSVPGPPVYDRYLLPSRGALDIFTALRGDALLRLELVVRADAFEMRMLVQVAETCPRLRIFEYHRYRDVPDTWEWDRRNLQPGEGVPIEALSSALSHFRAVRTLRLKLDFPLSFGEYTDHERYSDHATFIHGQAQIVANCMPDLEMLAIFSRRWLPTEQSYWREWRISVTLNGTVDLEDEERCGDHPRVPGLQYPPHNFKGRFRALVQRIIRPFRRDAISYYTQ